MKTISYTSAMQKNNTVIIESKELKEIYSKLDNPYSAKAIEFRLVIDKMPMEIFELNKILHSNISPIQYIDVMSNCKIYKVS